MKRLSRSVILWGDHRAKVGGSNRVEQDLFVEKNSFKLHLTWIYILRDGLAPTQEHTLSVRISEKRKKVITLRHS